VRDGLYEFDRDIEFDLSDPASYPFRFAWFQGGTTWDYSRWSWGLFVQDSWRIRPDLTLDLGLRYDVDGSYAAVNRFVRTDKGLNAVRIDRDNLAPRAAVAWTPFDNGGRTTLHGGVGLYYDENHQNVPTLLLNLGALVERALMLNASTPLLNPFWPDQARARQLLANALAANTVPDPALLPEVLLGSPDLASDLQVPLTVQASAGISHDFGGRLTASVDAVFARGIDQYVIGDRNIDLDATLQQGRIVRVNPNYSFINRYGNEGRFSYRSLQVQARFAPSALHFVKASYTLASTESNTHTSDIRHNLALNAATKLPFGLNLSAILSARSALPWSVVPVSAQLDPDPFFDRTEPRNSRRGDTFFSLDLRVARTVRFGARRSLTAFAELFNATNTTNYIAYLGTPGARQFGQPAAALERRRVQLGVRFEL
jgi:hypothetical protein